MIVKIYVLIDPITLKVRYIGRTTVSLPMRLSQHIHKSVKKKESTHKAHWIRLFYKNSLKPYIRLLTSVEGWKESYQFERDLIFKYRDRLLNHNDRGIGGKNVRVSERRRKMI